MGYIYKITNIKNQKLYIGQTRISVETRWKKHCSEAMNPNGEEVNFPLHKAIKKYGKECFLIETIEECSNDDLNNREIYWINFYNSYKEGYNASIGGDGHQKYDYDTIVNFFLANGNSLRKTCQYFKVYDQVVYSALKSKNIDYKSLPRTASKNIYRKKILMVEENKIFNTMAEIDKYFGKIVHPNIRRCLNGVTKKAYGYTWKEIE